ncbi:MAG TPA: hypothetical protein VFB23_10190 [Candidatus Acidoferrales bacterium]|jgi:hypothetical protein|nr:hypothetical protein [Candidatus Acidoferrales bacterium]
MVRYAKDVVVPDSWTKQGVLYTIEAKAGVGGVITAQRENGKTIHSLIVSTVVTREEAEKLFSSVLQSRKVSTRARS